MMRATGTALVTTKSKVVDSLQKRSTSQCPILIGLSGRFGGSWVTLWRAPNGHLAASVRSVDGWEFGAEGRACTPPSTPHISTVRTGFQRAQCGAQIRGAIEFPGNTELVRKYDDGIDVTTAQ
jgi:hypothetical protein